jgi:hypothetical protein
LFSRHQKQVAYPTSQRPYGQGIFS